MAQFDCEVCSAGFEQKSAYERHMLTSHPERAPSAADLEQALSGVQFPQGRTDLVAYAEENGQAEIAALLERLPDQEYRDAAEVARAFGALKSHQRKPDHQPSRLGGERALESSSAAKIASVFSGFQFPASDEELKEFARARTRGEQLEVIEQFRPGTYESMKDVAREIGAATERR